MLLLIFLYRVQVSMFSVALMLQYLSSKKYISPIVIYPRKIYIPPCYLSKYVNVFLFQASFISSCIIWSLHILRRILTAISAKKRVGKLQIQLWNLHGGSEDCNKKWLLHTDWLFRALRHVRPPLRVREDFARENSSNLIKAGQTWQNLVKLGKTCVKLGKTWQNLVK